MYPVGVIEIIGLVLVLWLLILSLIVWRERGFLHRLFPKGDERDIRNKFFEILKVIEEASKREEFVNKNIRDISRANLKNIQKVALSRYNPYSDLGGNVSFTLVMLDGKGDGILVTSLHTRSGTRLYAKEINKGKSELQLSQEEDETLKKALHE